MSHGTVLIVYFLPNLARMDGLSFSIVFRCRGNRIVIYQKRDQPIKSPRFFHINSAGLREPETENPYEPLSVSLKTLLCLDRRSVLGTESCNRYSLKARPSRRFLRGFSKRDGA